jgi:hypothetical protein
MEMDDVEWWPTQLQAVFAAIGAAMGGKRLTPETLQSVQLPDNRFSVGHVSGNEIGRRKGYYLITIKGGQWKFTSGRLERLCRSAARGQGNIH